MRFVLFFYLELIKEIVQLNISYLNINYIYLNTPQFSLNIITNFLILGRCSHNLMDVGVLGIFFGLSFFVSFLFCSWILAIHLLFCLLGLVYLRIYNKSLDLTYY
jgi:hypothetical protein